MPLPVKSFDQLVSLHAEAIQSQSTQLTDFTVGSVLRATIEADASQATFIEYLLELLLLATRASTSSGADLDSWMADFNLFRLPAVKAEGDVVFSRFTPTGLATINVGSIVKTSDGSQSFAVVADAGNPIFNPSLNAYVIPISTASGTVPVQALVGGVSGNAAADTVTIISSPISGVDTVNNPTPFTDGADIESDNAFRQRFVLYINSLSKATKTALAYAISQVPGVSKYFLEENKNFVSGDPEPGYFYAVIDDGSGSPPVELLNLVSASLDATRGFTIAFGVFGPNVLPVDIELTLVISTNETELNITNLVTAALTEYIATYPLSTAFYYSSIFQIVRNVSDQIINVTGVTLNAGVIDLPAVENQEFTIGAITINFA